MADMMSFPNAQKKKNKAKDLQTVLLKFKLDPLLTIKKINKSKSFMLKKKIIICLVLQKFVSTQTDFKFTTQDENGGNLQTVKAQHVTFLGMGQWEECSICPRNCLRSHAHVVAQTRLFFYQFQNGGNCKLA